MKSNKLKNLTYLIIFAGGLFALKFLLIDRIFTGLGKDSEIWFTSGLLLIILGVFVTEKYFTKPLDVIVNVITLFVVLLTLNDVSKFHLYWPLITYSLLTAVIALVSFVLVDEEKDRNVLSQKIAYSLNVISGFLGSSRLLFSIVFILSIFNYFVSSLESSSLINNEQIAVILLIIFWGVVILIEPIDRKLITPLLEKMKAKNKSRLIGKIVKRLNPDVIYVEQLPGSPVLKSGDIVVIDDVRHLHTDADLIAVSFYKTSTKYQIINVETDSESVDGHSKIGSKIITAQQIGNWQSDKQKFTDTGYH